MFFNKNTFNEINCNNAEKELANDTNIKLIDVRTNEEYASGHINNSIHIPLGNEEDIKKLIPEKDTKIFVYCKAGMRSLNAVKIYSSMGYTNVYTISGGIMSWNGNIVK